MLREYAVARLAGSLANSASYILNRKSPLFLQTFHCCRFKARFNLHIFIVRMSGPNVLTEPEGTQDMGKPRSLDGSIRSHLFPRSPGLSDLSPHGYVRTGRPVCQLFGASSPSGLRFGAIRSGTRSGVHRTNYFQRSSPVRCLLASLVPLP